MQICAISSCENSVTASENVSFYRYNILFSQLDLYGGYKCVTLCSLLHRGTFPFLLKILCVLFITALLKWVVQYFCFSVRNTFLSHLSCLPDDHIAYLTLILIVIALTYNVLCRSFNFKILL